MMTIMGSNSVSPWITRQLAYVDWKTGKELRIDYYESDRETGTCIFLLFTS